MTATDVRLTDAIGDFYATRHGSYAASSWRAITQQVERMRKWLIRETQPDVYLSDLVGYGERYMDRYFNRLRPPKYSPQSFNVYRGHVNLFWRFCRDEGWIAVNPMRHVDPLPVPQKVRLRLSAEELLLLLDGASPRDRIGLALGMNTALRAGDIARLKVGNVNLTNNTLSVFQRKTKTEAVLPVTVELRGELTTWFSHYAQVMGVTVDRLPNTWTLMPPAHWYSAKPGESGSDGWYKYNVTGTLTHPASIVQTALAKRGYETHREGFHTLRRSAARELHDLAAQDGVGDPIRVAQSLLGHRNRRTTEVYIGVTHEAKLRDDLMKGKSVLRRAAGQWQEVPAVELAERRKRSA